MKEGGMHITERNSSFELLRLIAAFMVVAYHIFLFYFAWDENSAPIYTAIQLPLHIGVLLFVLISGYFGIRVSLKGLFRIIGYLLVYGLLLKLIYCYVSGEHFPIRQVFFISATPFWFMRTYLILYLLSPMVNRFISSISSHTRWCALVILAYITLWMGWNGFDKTLNEGYDILNFIFLYMVGDTLHMYESSIKRVSVWYILVAYLFLNISIVIGYTMIPDAQSMIHHFTFPYNSPGLFINAVLFFMLFMHINIKSKFINYLASSALAVYLIGSGNLVLKLFAKEEVIWIGECAKTGGGANSISIRIFIVDSIRMYRYRQMSCSVVENGQSWSRGIIQYSFRKNC